MYQQPKYLKQDPEFIFKYLQHHPFASFVLQAKDLTATHIPILAEGTPDNFRLFGHIAHNNEQYQHLKDGAEGLLIFQGAHGYISSSWYKEKGISTWNYSAVHVNVRIKLQTPSELENSLNQLVHHFEKDQEEPYLYKDIPQQMLKEHLPLIQGFWGKPLKVQAISKMSQDHPQDVPSILRHLKKKGNSDLSSEMEREQ